MSTTYQQATIALRVTRPGNTPLDINGQLCSQSRRKQAIMILEGEENPAPNKYEIFGTFKAGEIVDGFQTIIDNPELCIPDIYEFEVDKASLSYGVSYQGLGFSFTDSILVTSSVNTSYVGYAITSKPSWITATLGTTTGVVNTLNLIVDRNRTDDNDRSGNIVLTQNETGVTRTIAVTQKGRLTEGIPTEYPYVNKEQVVDHEANVVQVGEQLWTQDNFHLDGDIKYLVSQDQLDNWCQQNGVSYPIKAEDYNQIFKSGYTKFFKNELIDNIQKYYASIGQNPDDIYTYQIPSYIDFYEFMGYLVAKAGGTSDAHFYLTTGQTLAKKILDETLNGYDDVRVSYPSDWRDNIGTESGLTDLLLKNGSDNYALGYMSLGTGHSNAPIVPKLFSFIEVMVKEDDGTYGDTFVNSMVYGLDTNPNAYGWFRRQNDNTTAHVKPIRLIRYRKLPYEVYYSSTEGKYTKINNGDTVPEGYTIVPKGTTRGIYLGNPNLSAGQIGTLSWWIFNNYMGTPNKKIG